MTTTRQRPELTPGSVDTHPVLPLRDIVVFPHMIVPLFVGREKSIKALEEVVKSEKLILLATQKNAADDDPATDAIFTIGPYTFRPSVPLASEDSQIGARMRVCLYGQDRTHPGSS